MTDRAHMPAPSKMPGPAVLRGPDRRRQRPTSTGRASTRTPPSSLCYTSGTTGNPKGALYSHRSTVLHTYAAALPDALNCSARDAILPVVPMFHVNAWGLPYVGLHGRRQAGLPRARPRRQVAARAVRGRRRHRLGRRADGLAGPAHPRRGQRPAASRTMRRTIIGGSACPPAMMRAFQERYDVQVLHAWGMTEMSPLGTVVHAQAQAPATRRRGAPGGAGQAGPRGLRRRHEDRRRRRPGAAARRQGLGRAAGARARGSSRSYFKGEGGDPLVDGWFPTGDVATIDADGYMQITDRSKDVIKSGGEWIGSIDLENIAMAHPGGGDGRLHRRARTRSGTSGRCWWW